MRPAAVWAMLAPIIASSFPYPSSRKTVPPPLIEARHQTGKVFFDPAAFPWTVWVMPQTSFKLLNMNQLTGAFAMLLKVEAPNESPIRRHIGPIEIYNMAAANGAAGHVKRTSSLMD